METVGVAELKKRLSEYLARVHAGEEIIVVSHGRPVARLLPATPASMGDDESRLQDLERRGLIRMGSGALPDDFWDLERMDDPQAHCRAALSDERSESL